MDFHLNLRSVWEAPMIHCSLHSELKASVTQFVPHDAQARVIAVGELNDSQKDFSTRAIKFIELTFVSVSINFLLRLFCEATQTFDTNCATSKSLAFAQQG